MLHEMLRESRHYSAEYGARLVNHLPMALLGLQRMGASGEQMVRFRDHYAGRLVERSPGNSLPAEGWLEARGKPEYESALIRYFESEVESRGVADTLDRHLPDLVSGIGSAAFHGVIRTAFALEGDDPQEIGDALAAWAIGYEAPPAPDPEQRVQFKSAEAAFAALAADARFGGEFRGASSTDRIAAAIAHPAFRDYDGMIDGLELRDLARIALAVYAATENFTALHMVTGCHAARVVFSHLEDEQPALAALTIALLAAYVSIGRPAFDAGYADRDPGAPGFRDIAARACESDDDHVIKFVFCCGEEEKRYGWPGFRAAAARKAGLL